MQISIFCLHILNFRYANIENTPYIHKIFLLTYPVLKYKFLALFIYPWAANVQCTMSSPPYLYNVLWHFMYYNVLWHCMPRRIMWRSNTYNVGIFTNPIQHPFINKFVLWNALLYFFVVQNCKVLSKSNVAHVLALLAPHVVADWLKKYNFHHFFECRSIFSTLVAQAV